MIFICDRCRFIFSRTLEPEHCPGCGKYAVRPADGEEQREYQEHLKKFQSGQELGQNV